MNQRTFLQKIAEGSEDYSGPLALIDFAELLDEGEIVSLNEENDDTEFLFDAEENEFDGVTFDNPLAAGERMK